MDSKMKNESNKSNTNKINIESKASLLFDYLHMILREQPFSTRLLVSSCPPVFVCLL